MNLQDLWVVERPVVGNEPEAIWYDVLDLSADGQAALVLTAEGWTRMMTVGGGAPDSNLQDRRLIRKADGKVGRGPWPYEGR